MSDEVELHQRLRNASRSTSLATAFSAEHILSLCPLMEEAADRIEELERDLDALKEAAQGQD